MSPSAALTALTTAIVDYAGLFPPATLDMPAAVQEYATYRRAPATERALLGRFVVPIARLDEFAAAAAAHVTSAADGPWPLTALGGRDAKSDARVLDDFASRFAGVAVIDAVEVNASTPETIARAVAAYSARPLFIEIPLGADLAPTVGALARAGVGAKMRTGGITPDAIPVTADVARFLYACHAAGVSFKATAGLHHPLRAEHRLTYEATSPSAVMHGFLNVFLAAAWIRTGLAPADTTELLREDSAEGFRFDDGGVAWRGHRLTTAQIRDARTHFAKAFGSCSFREPIEDLTALGLL